ncbi:MAG: hypoxanthine phosphoribosyltransferase [Bryobacteraceae bacterium]
MKLVFAGPLASAYYSHHPECSLSPHDGSRPAHATIRGMPHTLITLITAEQIRSRVSEMGREIDSHHTHGPIYLISVLKGSFVFLADLSRAMKSSVRIEFMAISSYGKDKTTSGQVKVIKDLDVSIEGRDLLIVEDIIDSGVTLNYLMRVFQQRRPKSIRIATLLDKPERRIQPVTVDYVGFAIPDEFVVGYGLDYAEDYRNLPDICVLSGF